MRPAHLYEGDAPTDGEGSLDRRINQIERKPPTYRDSGVQAIAPSAETGAEPMVQNATNPNVCARCGDPTNTPRMASGRRYCPPCIEKIVRLVGQMRNVGKPWASRTMPVMHDDD